MVLPVPPVPPEPDDPEPPAGGNGVGEVEPPEPDVPELTELLELPVYFVHERNIILQHSITFPKVFKLKNKLHFFIALKYFTSS